MSKHACPYKDNDFTIELGSKKNLHHHQQVCETVIKKSQINNFEIEQIEKNNLKQVKKNKMNDFGNNIMELQILTEQNRILLTENRSMVNLLNHRKKIINKLEQRIGEQIEEQIQNLQSIQEQKNKFLHQNAKKIKDQKTRMDSLTNQIAELKQKIYQVQMKANQETEQIKQACKNQLEYILMNHSQILQQMQMQNLRFKEIINDQTNQIQRLNAKLKIITKKNQEGQQHLVRAVQLVKLEEFEQKRNNKEKLFIIHKVVDENFNNIDFDFQKKELLQILKRQNEKLKQLNREKNEELTRVYSEMETLKLRYEKGSKSFEFQILQNESVNSQIMKHKQNLKYQQQTINEMKKKLQIEILHKMKIHENYQVQINSLITQIQFLKNMNAMVRPLPYQSFLSNVYQKQKYKHERYSQQIKLKKIQEKDQQIHQLKMEIKMLTKNNENVINDKILQNQLQKGQKKQNWQQNGMKIDVNDNTNYRQIIEFNKQTKNTELKQIVKESLKKQQQLDELKNVNIQTEIRNSKEISDEYFNKQIELRDRQIKDLKQKIAWLNNEIKLHMENEEKLEQNLRGLIQSQQRLRGMEQKAIALGQTNNVIKN